MDVPEIFRAADALSALEQVGRQLSEAEENYLRIKWELADAESRALTNGTIDGRNEQARQAQLWQHTRVLHERFLKAEIAKMQIETAWRIARERVYVAELALRTISPETR